MDVQPGGRAARARDPGPPREREDDAVPPASRTAFQHVMELREFEFQTRLVPNKHAPGRSNRFRLFLASKEGLLPGCEVPSGRGGRLGPPLRADQPRRRAGHERTAAGGTCGEGGRYSSVAFRESVLVVFGVFVERLIVFRLF